MGLILNLAVIVLAMVVVGSLALLAWTLGVSAVRHVRDGRKQVASSRQSVADAEARLRSASARATATLAELAQRTDPQGDRTDR